VGKNDRTSRGDRRGPLGLFEVERIQNTTAAFPTITQRIANEELFLFDLQGYLLLKDVMSANHVAAANEASP